MNLCCWYLVAVWLAVLLASPEDGLWMAVMMLAILALAWVLDLILHRNDKRNVS